MRWKVPPPTVGDQIGAATLDVLTLPVQAVAIPTSWALQRGSHSNQNSLEPKSATQKPSSGTNP